MSRATLTRGAAHGIVEGCATLSAALDLQEHWIGHRDYLSAGMPDCEAADLSVIKCTLREYVDECAFNGDHERSNGPKDSDDTGLTEPGDTERE